MTWKELLCIQSSGTEAGTNSTGIRHTKILKRKYLR
nr:unnamed protein product [Callosobruchus chinensis]